MARDILAAFPGESGQPQYGLTQLCSPLCAVLSRVSIPPAVTEAYSFTTDGYGIFNVRTHLGAHRDMKGWSSTNKSAQDLTRRDRKLNCLLPWAPPGDRTQESSGLNSDALTKSLRSPLIVRMIIFDCWQCRWMDFHFGYSNAIVAAPTSSLSQGVYCWCQQRLYAASSF